MPAPQKLSGGGGCGARAAVLAAASAELVRAPQTSLESEQHVGQRLMPPRPARTYARAAEFVGCGGCAAAAALAAELARALQTSLWGA